MFNLITDRWRVIACTAAILTYPLEIQAEETAKTRNHIPGSVYGQATFKGDNSLTPYRNIENTMRKADEILALWKSHVDTRKHLSFVCGGGWRAVEVLTFANVMGLTNTSLYSEGWIGWSNDQHNQPNR